MDRKHFESIINGEGKLDYELYLNTKQLLDCQKPFAELANHDEMMFLIVHQSEELWMKLINWTLLEIGDYMTARNTNRIITLFQRVQIIQRLMIDHFAVLETMSPKEYQEIRLQLGNGSGQESPGFNAMIQMWRPLWKLYVKHYLEEQNLTIEKIYN